MRGGNRQSLSAWLCGDTTPRDWPNMRRLLWLMFAWAVTFAGGAQLVRREIMPTGAIAWIAAAIPMVLAVFVLIAFGRFLRETDELNRRIQLQALALGFGGGWFAMAGYRVFELLGAPAIDMGGVVLVMTLLYAIGGVVGRIRYR